MTCDSESFIKNKKPQSIFTSHMLIFNKILFKIEVKIEGKKENWLLNCNDESIKSVNWVEFARFTPTVVPCSVKLGILYSSIRDFKKELRTRQLHYRKWYLMKFMLKQLLRSLSFFFFNRKHQKPPGRQNKPQISLGIRPILPLIQLQDQVSSELTLQTEQPCHIRGCLLGPEQALFPNNWKK